MQELCKGNYIAHLLEYYELDASITAIYSNTDENLEIIFC